MDMNDIDSSSRHTRNTGTSSTTKRFWQKTKLTPGLVVIGVVVLLTLVAGVSSGLSVRRQQKHDDDNPIEPEPDDEDNNDDAEILPDDDNTWCGEGIVGNGTCENESPVLCT